VFDGNQWTSGVGNRPGLDTLAVVMNDLNRRNWLKLSGAAALGLPLMAMAADDLRAKARKNLKLGIFTGVYSRFPLEEAARRMSEDGFHGVILEFGFADVRFDPWSPDWDKARLIRETLDKHNLKIAGLFGYYNVIDPDAARRLRGEQRMQTLLENWKEFGCPLVSTETGTLNAKSEWLESPDNAGEPAYQACRAAFQRWAALAAKTGAVVSIEAYWRNVVGSAPRAERLLHDVPGLKLVMDPCNYYRKEDLSRMDPILEEMFQRLGKNIVLAHAKDVRAAADNGTDLPAAGEGVLDYPLFLRLLAGLECELYVIIEHLTLEDVPRARDFVLGQFDKI
jgi:sugar phosphate isomerase/epimerase